MVRQSFKIRLKSLPLKEKCILIGAILIALGAVLPWYKDLDRFNTGDIFLGISGPLYLAGFIVLFSALASFGIILFKCMNKQLPKLPLTEKQIHIASLGLTAMMLVLVNSVYFHPKFGINLTEKSMGIGMIMVFMGLGLEAIGNIILYNSKEVNFDVEGKIEPLINIEDRTHGEIEQESAIEKDEYITMSKEKTDMLDRQKTLEEMLKEDNKYNY
ncbi:MAG: hypothetical protein WC806_00530 [Candidatus Gracilibacteria bacterium]|jgi:hypothetical protein